MEIGVRLALGALKRDIAVMVLRHAGWIVILGCSTGTLGAFIASRFVRGLLFNVAPGDPATFAAALLVLIGAVVAGAVIPAMRAMRVDPAVVLRYE